MPNTQNKDIQLVQAELIKRFNQLKRQLDDTSNFDDAQTIVREMQEVNHRITLAGSLLFAAQAQSLTDKADDVVKASNQAAKAIRSFQTVRDIMSAITAFLEVVDEAIDLAKML